MNNNGFPLDQLVELTKAYNRYVSKLRLDPKQNLYGGSGLIKINPNKSYLLSELQAKFNHVCSGNISKQDFMNEIVSKEYRDTIIRGGGSACIGPKGETEWLSTSDIDCIMKKYEEEYSDFIFLGAVPSDCDKLSFCTLYSLDFEKFSEDKITKVGIVFNHDVHGQPGSHWVGMYINIPDGHIYYCDSVGGKPRGRIGQTIDKFCAYYENKTKKNAVCKINNIRYQGPNDNSECGVYACNFLIRLLAGETFEEIIENPLKFEEINSCRNIYFSNGPTKKKTHKLCDPNSILKSKSNS